MFNREKDALQQELDEYNSESQSDVFEENRDLYESKDMYTDETANSQGQNYSANNFGTTPADVPLFDDETILWSGTSQKGRGIAVNGANGFLKIFAIIWLAMTIVPMLAMIVPTILAFRHIGSAFSSVFSIVFFIPFILVGVYLLRVSKNDTRNYLITNKRVIMKSRTATRSEFLNDLYNIRLTPGTNNIGAVIFSTKNNSFGLHNNSNTYADMGLYGVYNPQEVYNILNNAVESSIKRN